MVQVNFWPLVRFPASMQYRYLCQHFNYWLMKVVILLGSVRMGRQSHKIAHYLEHMLTVRGIETDLIDLGKDALPILGTQVDDDLDLPGTVHAISERLHQGDGLLLVTPEYHGSFSGALKNALDYFWAEFQKKAIGVVAVSTGKFGGVNAAHQLQQVILSLGGVALPTKLLVPEIQLAFGEDAAPLHDKIVRYTQKFLDEFLWFADAIYQKRLKEMAPEPSM